MKPKNRSAQWALRLAVSVGIMALMTGVQACPGKTYSGVVRLSSLNIPAGTIVRFDPNRSTTLEVTGNVIVQGLLQMRPANPGVVHTLRFVGINENRVVGGGMDPLPTDVGLWVMGAGKLDAAGAPKLAWGHLAGSVAAGAAQITLAETPAGWRVGDEIVIAPTTPGSYNGFEGAFITKIAGKIINLNRQLTTPHPKVANRFTAEVMNLTRNVNIGGTGDGGLLPTTNHRAHIFIRSTSRQNIRYVSVRHVGPRPATASTKRPVGAEQKWPAPIEIVGRYGIHFHHNLAASRGTVVEGTVVRDCGSHAYVTHMSDGITLRNTISYNTAHAAYWWDGPRLKPGGNLDNWREYQILADPTNDTMIDHAIAAKVKSGSNNGRLAGFDLGTGSGNSIADSVAVGVEPTQQGGAFHWPEANEGVWEFVDNLAHNNGAAGIFAWQNTTKLHVINNFTAYHNAVGIHHGAYANGYQYKGGYMYGNSRTGLLLAAVSSSATHKILFENIVVDGGGFGASAVETTSHRSNASVSTVLRNITMKGFKGAGAINFNTSGENKDLIDFINPIITGNAFHSTRKLLPGSVVTVQSGATRYKLTPATLGTKSLFIPTWNVFMTAF